MVALIITFCVILILLFLLLMPINAVIEYSSGGFITVKYLFLKFQIPLKDWQESDNNKTYKNNKTKRDKNNLNFLQKLIKNKGVVEAVSIVVDSLKTLILTVIEFLGNVKVSTFKFTTTVGQGDAAETGMVYGAVSAVCYTALAVINSVLNIENQQVNINSDFDKEILEISLYLSMKISMLKAIKAGIKALISLSKAKISTTI